jgi:predicted alpha/beta hydrolase
MLFWRGWFLGGLVLLLGVLAHPVHAQQAVSSTATDGVRVYGDYYPAASKTQPLILLFHQAGSNWGEYATIAPRLVKAGFRGSHET